MKQERAPFLPLAPDIEDDRLEQLARDKGVGVLERPAKTEQGTQSTPPPAAKTKIAGSDRSPTPRSRMKTVNLELPDYVWTELKIRAVQQQTSLRHVVMRALIADGVTINDPDMIEDGRRLR